MASEESLQCRVFRGHFRELVSSIQDPDSLADDLFSRHLLGPGMMHELQADGLSQWKKTRKILLAVQDQVVVHPEKFWEFVEALSSDSSRDYLAEKLRQACVPKALGLQETLAELRGFYAWFPLGLCLGVPKKKLQEIYSENGEGYDAVTRCMAKMIEAWLEMRRDANWPSLATALWQTGRKRLAAKIAEKFGFKDKFLSDPIPNHHALSREGAAEWRAKLERLDEEFANDQHDFVDNEREKRILEEELSDANEHLKSTRKYLQLLQHDKKKVSILLKEAKYSLEVSLSVPTQTEQQIQEKKEMVAFQEERNGNLTKRIEKAVLELESIKENMSVLTDSFSELSTRQKRLQDKKCVLMASLRQHEEALNGNENMYGEPLITPTQLQVSYYNVMITSTGMVEVKLRQSEIELIEHKMEQKQMEVSLLTDQLKQLETKIEMLERHLRSQKADDGEYSELELFRLQTERLLTRRSISTADSQKHKLQCEKKMQAQAITSIEKELADRKEPPMDRPAATASPENHDSTDGQPYVGSTDSPWHNFEEVSSDHTDNATEKVTVRGLGATNPPITGSDDAPPPIPLRMKQRMAHACIAKVLFSYNPNEVDELTLRPGQVVEVTGEMQEGWWKGRICGIFPSNYVEIIPDTEVSTSSSSSPFTLPHQHSPPSPFQFIKVEVQSAKVLFPYHAKEPEELTLEPGQVVEVTGEVQKGWWKGRIGREVGLFPSNYVETIPDGNLIPSTQESRHATPPTTTALTSEDTIKTHHLPTDVSLPSENSVFPVTSGDNSNFTKGIIKVMAEELIYTDDESHECWVWPFEYIRKYGCEGDRFLFQAGRKCPGGETMYVFCTEKAAQLFEMVAQNTTKDKEKGERALPSQSNNDGTSNSFVSPITSPPDHH